MKRKAVNEWIRTGRAFDGVIDFEKAVRDPKQSGSDAARPTMAGTTCIPATRDIRRWARRSICRCSSKRAPSEVFCESERRSPKTRRRPGPRVR